jgi:uncharacterized protein (UPF0332 family)
MVTLKWCLRQKQGLKEVEANDNLADSYAKMADDAIGTMNREKDYNLVFSVSACYYSMYYSLLSILRKIGIKCEIHSCSIEFMRAFLSGYFSKEDIELIKKAFDARNISQYYADRVVDQKEINHIISKAPGFVSKSKEILSELNENDIKTVIAKLKGSN